MTIEYREALEKLYQARQDFEYADKDYVEIAILKLKAAEDQFSLALKNIKKGEKQCF